ncbi:hypothetical protein GCM10023321_14260 [Pseudonocardia eucalypti]|uniref:Uncharacterized protein n=1 Tax=Pseudonocardia eucalypti TaxID=648755 RepID=A0ABP9PP14_9PSEU|nr:hypothetical protein [Pseudonocardia eucalypti]
MNDRLGAIGENRTLGYAAHGAAGMVIGMRMPILVFFYIGLEHSVVVNMFLFPSGLMLHGKFRSRTPSSGTRSPPCSATWSVV